MIKKEIIKKIKGRTNNKQKGKRLKTGDSSMLYYNNLKSSVGTDRTGL